jgi:hypothetical protein
MVIWEDRMLIRRLMISNLDFLRRKVIINSIVMLASLRINKLGMELRRYANSVEWKVGIREGLNVHLL